MTCGIIGSCLGRSHYTRFAGICRPILRPEIRTIITVVGEGVLLECLPFVIQTNFEQQSPGRLRKGFLFLFKNGVHLPTTGLQFVGHSRRRVDTCTLRMTIVTDQWAQRYRSAFVSGLHVFACGSALKGRRITNRLPDSGSAQISPP